jgi:SAM-dependent methyltransferase
VTLGGADRRLARGSPERFGFSWNEYGEILADHEGQFRRWTAPLQPEDWIGKRILDAGCGIGRNSYWPLTYGAAECVAIDVDDRTLARACINLAAFPNARVERLSIFDVQDRDEFDIVFSIGVVHHLQDPELAMARLAQAARPGGKVLVWLYGRENNTWIVAAFDPLRKLVFSRAPLELVHAVSWPATVALWLALQLPWPKGPYLKSIRRFRFRHLQAIIFDHMIPKVARYYRRDEAIRLLADAGLVDIVATWTNRMSWTVIGKKPQGARESGAR